MIDISTKPTPLCLSSPLPSREPNSISLAPFLLVGHAILIWNIFKFCQSWCQRNETRFDWQQICGKCNGVGFVEKSAIFVTKSHVFHLKGHHLTHLRHQAEWTLLQEHANNDTSLRKSYKAFQQQIFYDCIFTKSNYTNKNIYMYICIFTDAFVQSGLGAAHQKRNNDGTTSNT